MSPISDSELQKIVQSIVRQAVGDRSVNQSAALDKTHRDSNPEIEAGEAQPENIASRRIAIGADHGGFVMKEDLKTYLQGKGYQVDDCGTYNTDSVDYPDFAYAVALKVSEGKAWRGIVLENQYPWQVQVQQPSPDGEMRQKAPDRRSRECEVAARSCIDAVGWRSQQRGDLAVRQARALDGWRPDQLGETGGRHAA